jgi:hypothetical protein
MVILFRVRDWKDKGSTSRTEARPGSALTRKMLNLRAANDQVVMEGLPPVPNKALKARAFLAATCSGIGTRASSFVTVQFFSDLCA